MHADSVTTKLRQYYERFAAMAESRGSLIAKSVQKHAGRAKEKVSDILFLMRDSSSSGAARTAGNTHSNN